MDIAQNVSRELNQKLNETYSILAKLTTFKFNLFVYNLVTKGHVSKAVVAKEAGMDESSI